MLYTTVEAAVFYSLRAPLFIFFRSLVIEKKMPQVFAFSCFVGFFFYFSFVRYAYFHCISFLHHMLLLLDVVVPLSRVALLHGTYFPYLIILVC